MVENQDHFNIDRLEREIELINKELRHSKYVVIFLLFASTLLLLLWTTVIIGGLRFYVQIVIAGIPLLLNAISWLLWGSGFAGFLPSRSYRKDYDTSVSAEIIERYEASRYFLRRQRFVETFVVRLTALQFVFAVTELILIFWVYY